MTGNRMVCIQNSHLALTRCHRRAAVPPSPDGQLRTLGGGKAKWSNDLIALEDVKFQKSSIPSYHPSTMDPLADHTRVGKYTVYATRETNRKRKFETGLFAFTSPIGDLQPWPKSLEMI